MWARSGTQIMLNKLQTTGSPRTQAMSGAEIGARQFQVRCRRLTCLSQSNKWIRPLLRYSILLTVIFQAGPGDDASQRMITQQPGTNENSMLNDDQKDLNDILSDDDDDDKQTALQKIKESGNVQKLLMHIPPDFDLAEINGVRQISCFNIFIESYLGVQSKQG